MGMVVETVFSAGDPTPFPPGNQLALLSIGALTAIRQGRVEAGERLIAEMNQLGAWDGALSGQSHAWAQVQLLMFSGKQAESASLLWESSLKPGARDARFAAVTGLLAAVEFEPTTERLETIRAYLIVVDEPAAFHAQY